MSGERASPTDDDRIAKSGTTASNADLSDSRMPQKHQSCGLLRRRLLWIAVLITVSCSLSRSGPDMHALRKWLMSAASMQDAAIDAQPSLLGPDYVFHHLAQHGPYRPTAEYPHPPEGCTIDKVIILQRHAARFPTTGALRAMHRLVDRLKAASVNVTHPNASKFEFLRDLQLTLGEESLVPYGRKEARTSGREAYLRYSHLAPSGTFVRSSSSSRVVHSSKLWIEGFASSNYTGPKINPPVIISDTHGSNDTLANNNCPNWRRLRAEWQWASVFTAPIARRFEGVFTSESQLTLSESDVIVGFWLCAFESIARGATSPFCYLFTKEEFLHFEYFQDLEKYYNRGYGNALGAVQGIGWSRELLARLTEHPVEDHTQTNTTLNSNPKTFPLVRGIHADFSHDNTIAAIVAAIGLFSDTERLSCSHPDNDRSWRFGNIAPFSGRIVFERLSCGSMEPHIRILGNDALLSASSDTNAHGPVRLLSRCVYNLADFITSLTARLNVIEAVWSQCHESGHEK